MEHRVSTPKTREAAQEIGLTSSLFYVRDMTRGVRKNLLRRSGAVSGDRKLDWNYFLIIFLEKAVRTYIRSES